MRKLLLSTLLVASMNATMYGRENEDKNQNKNDSNKESKDEINVMDGRRDGETSDHHAPEIDPNSAISAIFLLSSGVLMIRGRRKQ
jgi:hypothetical protein